MYDLLSWQIFGVISQRGAGECRDEFRVVDHVKSFGEVNCHGQRAEWGTGLVETFGYVMCNREEAVNGGVVRTEAMLDG